MLFAQAGGGPDFDSEDIALIAVIIVFLVVYLTVMIFFLLTLHRTLGRIHPNNRTMEPWQVWLNLIPCFVLIWAFITVNRIAESLDNEFYDRRIRSEEDFGRGLGMTAAVLEVLAKIPYIGLLFSIAAMICWIIYWVKIAGYSRQLRMDDEDDYGRERDEGDDDDYDRRDRRDRRDRDDDYDR